MTPIKQGTARRLGLRSPLASRVLAFLKGNGFTVTPFQEWMLLEYYARRGV